MKTLDEIVELIETADEGVKVLGKLLRDESIDELAKQLADQPGVALQPIATSESGALIAKTLVAIYLDFREEYRREADLRAAALRRVLAAL